MFSHLVSSTSFVETTILGKLYIKFLKREKQTKLPNYSYPFFFKVYSCVSEQKKEYNLQECPFFANQKRYENKIAYYKHLYIIVTFLLSKKRISNFEIDGFGKIESKEKFQKILSESKKKPCIKFFYRSP